MPLRIPANDGGPDYVIMLNQGQVILSRNSKKTGRFNGIAFSTPDDAYRVINALADTTEQIDRNNI